MDTAIKSLGVVGAGQMGSGIAQVFAQIGLQIIIVDPNPEAIKKSLDTTQKSLKKFFDKGLLKDAPELVLARITASEELAALSNCDIVIEAVNENENLKKQILQKLDQILLPQAIIATNTSSLSITRLSSYTKRAAKFIGMHFMNPVPLLPLVELIRAHQTSDETYLKSKNLLETIGKKTICVNDFPGFCVNRILMVMINEAFYALMEGVATAEDIDTAMKLGTNQAMGPLALADFIGLDTCLSIVEVLFEGLGDSKYRPCPLLRKYVDAGQFGKKTGWGVFKYT